jgi:hypothetical protein
MSTPDSIVPWALLRSSDRCGEASVAECAWCGMPVCAGHAFVTAGIPGVRCDECVDLLTAVLADHAAWVPNGGEWPLRPGGTISP